MDFVPEESAIKIDRIEVDKKTIDLLAALGMSEMPGVVLKEEIGAAAAAVTPYGSGRDGYGAAARRRY